MLALESDFLLSWFVATVSIVKLAQLMSPESWVKPSFPEFLA